MPKTGDIVLVPFPFTDLSQNKVRPAVVLAVHRDDLTLVFVSSVSPKNIDFTLHLSRDIFQKVGLKKESWVLVSKIATLDRNIVLGKIGSLDHALLKKLKIILKDFFEI